VVKSRRLEELLRAQPDLTLAETKRRLRLNCTVAAVGYALKRLGYTRKKRRSAPRNSSVRTWPANAPSGHSGAEADQTAAQTNLTRRYAYTPRGQRAVGYAPRNWQATTVIGAMNQHGPVAAMVIGGATDRIVFTTYVREVLLRPGEVVILDNLSAHHGPAVATLIAGAQVELWFLTART
jgi:hypothetical protein